MGTNLMVERPYFAAGKQAQDGARHHRECSVCTIWLKDGHAGYDLQSATIRVGKRQQVTVLVRGVDEFARLGEDRPVELQLGPPVKATR
ncbi:hypothetical protein [Bradyrhizobium centrosematis]|uniref:hypothetical protein n=1 Tax=Bradyrhizobium centrosematis TaxID=1300039 RepID=UPI0038901C0A